MSATRSDRNVAKHCCTLDVSKSFLRLSSTAIMLRIIVVSSCPQCLGTSFTIMLSVTIAEFVVVALRLVAENNGEAVMRLQGEPQGGVSPRA